MIRFYHALSGLATRSASGSVACRTSRQESRGALFRDTTGQTYETTVALSEANQSGLPPLVGPWGDWCGAGLTSCPRLKQAASDVRGRNELEAPWPRRPPISGPCP
jgi:hypothetical protein